MAKREGELTPLMKQYWDIKSLHQDKVLLFRMGDFYEIFYDDALKASPLLGITLTQRNKKSEDQTPMCGFPHHSVAGPINKLLAAGYKVAVCDQVEDPATAKGIVRRAVTRILTPGMVYDSETLDHSKAHYLVSIGEGEISFVDSTTGEAFFYETNRIDEMLSLIDLLPVAEIVLAEDDLETIEKLKSENRWTISPFKRKSEANSQQRLIHYIKSLANEELAKLIRPFQKREFEHRLSISNSHA